MPDNEQTEELMSDFEIDSEKISEIIEEHANEGGLVVASEMLPTGLPIIPLRPRPAFPGIMMRGPVSLIDSAGAFPRDKNVHVPQQLRLQA